MKTRLYKTPPPYFIVLASSVKTKDVKVIEFHRIYRLFTKGPTEQGHSILGFFHTRPQAVHLHNLTQKSNVLLINGKGYAEENKDCRVGLYSNKQISYQGHPNVIAKLDNSSSYIKQLLRNSVI